MRSSGSRSSLSTSASPMLWNFWMKSARRWWPTGIASISFPGIPLFPPLPPFNPLPPLSPLSFYYYYFLLIFVKRVVKVLEFWINNHSRDFRSDNKLLENVTQMLKDVKERDGMDLIGKQMLALLTKKVDNKKKTKRKQEENKKKTKTKYINEQLIVNESITSLSTGEITKIQRAGCETIFIQKKQKQKQTRKEKKKKSIMIN